jgi:hypothetical protein
MFHTFSPGKLRQDFSLLYASFLAEILFIDQDLDPVFLLLPITKKTCLGMPFVNLYLKKAALPFAHRCGSIPVSLH